MGKSTKREYDQILALLQVFPPAFIATNKPCAVDGCTNATNGKAYCHAHFKDKGKSTIITSQQRSLMRSDCCNAACIDGDRHDYGKQYCQKCKQACCWHPFAAVVNSK